jgi:hypothetical protein
MKKNLTRNCWCFKKKLAGKYKLSYHKKITGFHKKIDTYKKIAPQLRGQIKASSLKRRFDK